MTPLPPWTLEEIEAELVRLFPDARTAMVRHLIAGLHEDLPSLSSQEVLRELLCLLTAVTQPMVRSTRAGPLPSSEGAPMT